MPNIDRERINSLMKREEARFIAERPKSQALFEQAKSTLIGGVPMQWMVVWASPFPIFAKEAHGAHITDVDGHRYLDLCLGDTGSMFGHSPAVVAEAVAEQVRQGITLMLPTEDSVWVGEELARRFGLPYWQVAMTATDANRFALRFARKITGRKLILVFNNCYHGTVDEALATVRDGVVTARAESLGSPVDLALTTRVVEFNDVEALEKVLSPRDVACVLCEPALTNIGIVLPDPGYHEALREITRRHGTLLIIDETHTICAGPGGYTRAFDLDPDMLTLGKPIASGVPVAVYGFCQEVAEKVQVLTAAPGTDVAGIGGTLSGNALALRAMRATLENVMTDAAYDRMISLAERLADGVEKVIHDNRLPWHVTRLGARVEYRFQPNPPRNGAEAELGGDLELDRLVHLYCLNRGVLVTPFHNMLLISPDTTAEDIDLHTKVFAGCVGELVERC